MKTVKFVKNIILFVVCFVASYVLSMPMMPLNRITLGITDWSYRTFGGLEGVYESGNDPLSFTVLIVMLLIYSSIFFVIIRKLFPSFFK